MLTVKNLNFSYNRNRKVLCDVSFSLEAGSIMTVLGPNGVGKSTLFDCLCRLKSPDSGEIILDGKHINSYTIKQLASIITLLSQTVKASFDFTVREYVLMGCAPRISPFGSPKASDYDDVEKVLADLEISHFADKIFTKLSGGEKQQVSIAKAIIQRPKIMLFDEPTSFLDIGNQQKILRIIKKMAQAGYSVIMTTHNPDHAIQLGGICALIHPGGNMTVGSPESLSAEVLSGIYKTPLHLLNIEELGRCACIAG
ncbi:MAG: ABC transporter ATP-binding protein [Defluviitaleaceae bacterium]|nr:ABC transporter ATP-binding protein [Defluviitaleaceae bacterium]